MLLHGFLYLITFKGLILPKPILRVTGFPICLFTVIKKEIEQSSPALTTPTSYKVKDYTLQL